MNVKASHEELIEITEDLLRSKYPSARLTFLAGSIVRGEGTRFSDLDIVVIFDELPNAYRESLYFQGFPVEAFVHTVETLNYFFELDANRLVPNLARMVAEGLEIPGKSELSEKLKALAKESLNCPPEITAEEIRTFRYGITDLIDDIREPRSKAELTASGTELYEKIANFYWRTNGFWLTGGKSIPRQLEKHNADFYKEFTESFEELFVGGKPAGVIKLAENLLEKYGGFLFDGLRLDAPPEWKKTIK